MNSNNLCYEYKNGKWERISFSLFIKSNNRIKRNYGSRIIYLLNKKNHGFCTFLFNIDYYWVGKMLL